MFEAESLSSLAAVAAVMDTLGQTSVTLGRVAIESVLLRKKLNVSYDTDQDSFTFNLTQS